MSTSYTAGGTGTICRGNSNREALPARTDVVERHGLSSYGFSRCGGMSCEGPEDNSRGRHQEAVTVATLVLAAHEHLDDELVTA